MKKYLLIILWIIIIVYTGAGQNQFFFSNSENPNYYDPSYLVSVNPSTLLKVNSTKFPVNIDTFYSATNALKLEWKSLSGGDWYAAITSSNWIGAYLTPLDTLCFWLYSPQAISPASLPKIYLQDLSNQKTAKIEISGFANEISPNVWQRIKIPVSAFVPDSGSVDFTKIRIIYFSQSIDDGIQHTLFVDEIKMISPFFSFYKNIVVLGSSTAAGTGPTNPDSAWVNRFRNFVISQDSIYKVINLAVGGYTTYHVMPSGYIPPVGRPLPNISHNITSALTYNPVAVLINLPSNDASNSYPVSEQIANYDTLVRILNDHQIPFWVSTPQPRNFSNQSQLDLLFEMKDSTYSRYGSNAVDFWTELAQENGWINPVFNSGDGIHLNNAAHRILFERMRDAVIPNLMDLEHENVRSGNFNFHLNNNFPNPFNPSTVISFNVQKKVFVKIDVLNALGELVENLISSEMDSGSHSVNFNAKNLSSGIYLCRLMIIDSGNEKFFAYNKMLLVK